MQKKVGAALVLFMIFALCLGSLAQAAPLSDQAGAGKVYTSSVGQALDKAGCITLGPITRKQLVGNIYEYSLVMKVGPGAYDKIGLHRVSMEQAPWIPALTKNAVMMIHGDTSSFDAAFAAPSPDQQSLAIFLAQQGVDVWGIDLRWVLVPDDTTDFSFMKSWNTALHLKDIKKAVQVCRVLRGLTVSSSGKIIMLGHSRGAQLVYAYANQEALLPAPLQDLKGLIPMDFAYKFDPHDPDALALKQNAHNRYDAFNALYRTGTYNTSDGAILKGLAALAASAPTEMSKYDPSGLMDNYQFALAALTATYASTTPDLAYTPFFHYLAGTFDGATQLPSGLKFADPSYVLSLGMATPGFQSIGEQIDGEAIASDAAPVPYDDHLRQIKVPVFYVGAGGGAGQYGAYTLTLLGGSDKKTLIVSTGPNPYLDYGHADLLWANNAKNLAWIPVSAWIAAH